MSFFIEALNTLRPNGCWLIRGNDSYENIEWRDTEQTKPTEAEISAEVARLQAAHDAVEYQRQRAAEYPPVADYLDAVVKGDQEQIDAYIAACLAVKAKYPKPE